MAHDIYILLHIFPGLSNFMLTVILFMMQQSYFSEIDTSC